MSDSDSPMKDVGDDDDMDKKMPAQEDNTKNNNTNFQESENKKTLKKLNQLPGVCKTKKRTHKTNSDIITRFLSCVTYLVSLLYMD